jgi:hypothetical protein
MDALILTASVIGPIVVAIMVLTLFFRFLSWFSGEAPVTTNKLRFRGIVDEHSRVNVHLANGNCIE